MAEKVRPGMAGMRREGLYERIINGALEARSI